MLGKEDMAYLSEVLGPRGAFLDADEGLDIDDDDLKADPVSQIDLKVSLLQGYHNYERVLIRYIFVGTHPRLLA